MFKCSDGYLAIVPTANFIQGFTNIVPVLANSYSKGVIGERSVNGFMSFVNNEDS
jgi:hypothetical protein